MTAFDMTDSIVPKSDQLNAEDLLTGARTVTITEVRHGSAEQPVEVILAEFGPGRPFKPSKTVRRIMVGAWGPDASKYVGHRMTLYRDPSVKFGGMDVGGIRVSHMSHIDKRITLALTVTRGKRAAYVVNPLPDAPPSSGMDEFNADTTHWRDPGPLITPAQSKRLFAALNDAGLGDKAAALTFISGQIGREIETSKELTTDQAAAVIDALDAMLADPADTDALTLDGGA